MSKKNANQTLTPEQAKALLATIYQELKVVFKEMENFPIKRKKTTIASGEKALSELEHVLKNGFDHVPSANDAPLFSIFENTE